MKKVLVGILAGCTMLAGTLAPAWAAKKTPHQGGVKLYVVETDKKGHVKGYLVCVAPFPVEAYHDEYTWLVLADLTTGLLQMRLLCVAEEQLPDAP
jgi:hypothetical protein